MTIKHLLLAASLVAVPATAALAQTTAAERHHIDARKESQQDRIGQGVKSGQLTPREAARLEHQQRGIHREERGMRAQNNGHLTAQDRQILARQQNQESRRIEKQKHDAQTSPR